MTFLQILRPIYVPLVIFLIHIIDRLCKLYTSQLMVNYAGDVQKFWQKKHDSTGRVFFVDLLQRHSPC